MFYSIFLCALAAASAFDCPRTSPLYLFSETYELAGIDTVSRAYVVPVHDRPMRRTRSAKDRCIGGWQSPLILPVGLEVAYIRPRLLA